jgi:pimeloyl-ACP methyl ester carboxylesterase
VRKILGWINETAVLHWRTAERARSHAGNRQLRDIELVRLGRRRLLGGDQRTFEFSETVVSYQGQFDAAAPVPSGVAALHCTLSSGRQWAPLVKALTPRWQTVTPDIAGYGDAMFGVSSPASLASEVEFLSAQLDRMVGPLHLVGHSYGGAIAFKAATMPRFAVRLRSLTLIEPCLPSILLDRTEDRPLYDGFAKVSQWICSALSHGDAPSALETFIRFWSGPGAWERVVPQTRARMLLQADKVASDFSAAFTETDVAEAARRIDVPVLLFAGEKSPEVTRRITQRLAAVIPSVACHQVHSAGHMLAITHSAAIVPQIVRHIAAADDVVRQPAPDAALI